MYTVHEEAKRLANSGVAPDNKASLQVMGVTQAMKKWQIAVNIMPKAINGKVTFRRGEQVVGRIILYKL